MGALRGQTEVNIRQPAGRRKRKPVTGPESRSERLRGTFGIWGFTFNILGVIPASIVDATLTIDQEFFWDGCGVLELDVCSASRVQRDFHHGC